MSAFPTLQSGAVSMYPVLHTTSRGTTAIQFANGSEQRWRARAPLASFTLSCTDVDGYDMSEVLEFFRTRKGRFVDVALSNTFTLTLPVNGTPTTFNYLVFDQDDLPHVETKPNRFSFTLKMKQVRRN